MPGYKQIPFIFILLLVACQAQKQSSIVVNNMRCEYLIDPEGIDAPRPRLSWTLDAVRSDDFGQRQTAYRIIVASNEKMLAQNKGDLWDSDRVASDAMQHIEYDGKPLVSDKTYYWKVCVEDESGNRSNWSETAYWTTGLLNDTDWTAEWIGTDVIFDAAQEDCNIPDPWLRKSFRLDAKPTKAVMFVASVGFHELYVNGKKIGDQVLAPCVSDHTKRARYIAYDIAEELQPGENVIALWLGTSWAIFKPYATDDKPQTPMVIAQADIYAGDSGKSVRIATDASWKTHPSPNRLAGRWDMHKMGGDIWDANKEISDWNLVGFDDGAWKQATVYSPKLKLSAQQVEKNLLFDEVRPVSIEEHPDGSFRVDMGVNFAGWTEIRVAGKPGDRVDFLFSERRQNEMTFGIRSAYIIGAPGKGTFRNRFNYHSGRWITIRGAGKKPELSDIRGWVVRTAYEPAATFECSDSLQNWIYDRVRWTFENLSIGGYIVDCPQRERLGYGGDAHATSETGMFNYRLGAFYTKWMEDWRDVQGTEPMGGRKLGNGVLPHTAPTYFGGGGPAWGGICVTLPWLMYQHYGDKRVLEDNFQLIADWLAYLDTHVSDGIMQRFGGEWDFLGDWLWPNATAEGMNNNKPETLCLNNCYRVYNLRTAAKIARLIGKTTDAERWEKQAEVSSRAIHAKFYDENDHSYADRSMANLAAALYGEVPPIELREVVMQRLEQEILTVRKGHIHVGITAGAMLFKVLRDAGRDDLIYSMTSQTDYPGWGYMRANGATTIWEMWEKDLPGHSLLHSSYLYPGAWYVDGMAGIRRNPDIPGFRRFVIRPPFLKESQISWAKASFDSPAGTIKTDWKYENGRLKLNVTIPPNSMADVYFPADNVSGIVVSSDRAKTIGKEGNHIRYELIPGSYRFESN